MLAAERNVQHLTKNAPVAANNRNEFRWSASGQKATLQGDRRMSGLTQKADVRVAHRQCPLGAINGLMQRSIEPAVFDHLVAAGERREWNGETERLSGFLD